jgi:hypothetical protein
MATILPVRDPHVGMRISKPDLFDLPMRLIIVGKSQLSGKSTLISNLLLRPWSDDDKNGSQFYKNNFDGDNIFIVCPSFDLDVKMTMIQKGLEIPDSNIYREYDESELESWYNRIEESFKQDVADGKKPKHTLLVLDDCAFSGALKATLNGVLSKIACNGRHILISMIVSAQKYTSISTIMRENCSGLICFESSAKQVDTLYEDHGNMSRKQFDKMFRDTTKDKHSFIVVNYSNDSSRRFMDSNFTAIKV